MEKYNDYAVASSEATQKMANEYQKTSILQTQNGTENSGNDISRPNNDIENNSPSENNSNNISLPNRTISDIEPVKKETNSLLNILLLILMLSLISDRNNQNSGCNNSFLNNFYI